MGDRQAEWDRKLPKYPKLHLGMQHMTKVVFGIDGERWTVQFKCSENHRKIK